MPHQPIRMCHRNSLEVQKCCTMFTRPTFPLGVLTRGLGTRLSHKTFFWNISPHTKTTLYCSPVSTALHVSFDVERVGGATEGRPLNYWSIIIPFWSGRNCNALTVKSVDQFIRKWSSHLCNLFMALGTHTNKTPVN